jgi:hypothetical protein
MGLIADTPEIYTFRCDSCDSTYTGKPHELQKLGWVRHMFGPRKKGEFLMCKECEGFFAVAWKRNEKKRAA